MYDAEAPAEPPVVGIDFAEVESRAAVFTIDSTPSTEGVYSEPDERLQAEMMVHIAEMYRDGAPHQRPETEGRKTPDKRRVIVRRETAKPDLQTIAKSRRIAVDRERPETIEMTREAFDEAIARAREEGREEARLEIPLPSRAASPEVPLEWHVDARPDIASHVFVCFLGSNHTPRERYWQFHLDSVEYSELRRAVDRGDAVEAANIVGRLIRPLATSAGVPTTHAAASFIRFMCRLVGATPSSWALDFVGLVHHGD